MRTIASITMYQGTEDEKERNQHRSMSDFINQAIGGLQHRENSSTLF